MDRESFVAEILRNGSDDEAAVMGRIFDWADGHGLRDIWSLPSYGHGYYAVMQRIEWEPTPIGVRTSPPRLFIEGDKLRRHAPFNMERNWDQVLERLYAIPQVKRTEGKTYPNILLRDLQDQGTWSAFFGVVDEVIDRVRRAADRGLR